VHIMSELDQTAEGRAVASVEAAVDDSFLSRKADLKGGANEAKAKKDGENCCQCKENSDCTDSTACECDDCDEDCKRTTAWVFATPLLIPTIPVAILLKEMINKTYALDRYLRNHLTWPEDELIPSVTGSLGLGRRFTLSSRPPPHIAHLLLPLLTKSPCPVLLLNHRTISTAMLSISLIR
jgi:hypothetical protein